MMNARQQEQPAPERDDVKVSEADDNGRCEWRKRRYGGDDVGT
jgi:hypothetical protein